MIRCEYCGYQNPAGALVCRRCRRRLRPVAASAAGHRGRRGEAAGPRRATEGELTLIVARELTRLAWMISIILALGVLLAIPVAGRFAPGLVVIVVIGVAVALFGQRHVATLRAQSPTDQAS